MSPLGDNGNGYVYLNVRPLKLRIGIHVLSFIASNGDLPEGHFVLHKCDNRGCWNPDHLFSGTQGDNMQDKKQKGRAIGPMMLGRVNPACKLSEEIVRIIRGSNSQNKVLAAQYEVSATLIAYIKKRKIWKHVA